MVVFVLGGASSGKSSFALSLAEGKKLYVATCEFFDEEMEEKVKRHREERGDEWDLVEEPVNIHKALSQAKEYDTVIVDSVTVWVGNMLVRGMDRGRVLKEINRILEAAKSLRKVVFVSDEVGMGIVPENSISRRFRNILGEVNQKIAKSSGEVYVVFAGIPVRIK